MPKLNRALFFDEAPAPRTLRRPAPQLSQRVIDFDRPPQICRLFVDCHDPADQARLARYLRAKGYEVREVTI